MQRLVTVTNADGIDTPPDLLAQLRAIDPAIELVYAGEGWWWLGAVRPSRVRYRDGAHILQVERARGAQANPRNILLGRLAMEGFAMIEKYRTLAGDPAGPVETSSGYHTTIVEDLRWRDAEWRRDQGATRFQAQLDADQKVEQKAESRARMIDYLRTEGRAHYRRERGRLVAGPAGVTGGPGRTAAERAKQQHKQRQHVTDLATRGLILPGTADFDEFVRAVSVTP